MPSMGWKPDSLSCGQCGLMIPGFGGWDLIDQARDAKIPFELASHIARVFKPHVLL